MTVWVVTDYEMLHSVHQTEAGAKAESYRYRERNQLNGGPLYDENICVVEFEVLP